MSEVGQVVDLAIRFGNQVRYKCLSCKRYFAAREGVSECACGASYSSVGKFTDGVFKVVRLP